MCCGMTREAGEQARRWVLGALTSQIAMGRAGGESLRGQLHIRQHIPMQPGIIIPAVLFASWADKGRALVVMGWIMSEKVARCQNESRCVDVA